MPWKFRLQWIMFIPLRIMFWPILWYDIRQRRLGKKPDEWHKFDKFLISKDHVVVTYGYWFWEKKAKICWECVILWALFFGGFIGGRLLALS